MRTLHIIESTFGGPRRYLGDLVRALEPGDGPFAIAYSLERADFHWSGVIDAALERDYQMFPLEFGPNWSFPGDLRHASALRRVIENFQPEIVHSHNRRAAGLTALALFRMRDRPKHAFSPYTYAQQLSRRHRGIDRTASRFVDRVFAVHESERARLAALGIVPRGRISLLEPAVDLAHFAPRDRDEARAELGLGAAPLVLGLGDMEPHKDPLLFLSIVDRAKARVPKLRAIWVGDGALRGEFERAVAARELTATVRTVATVEDVRPYIAAADVVLSAARFLPFGYSVLEALAMERPVVALAGPGPSDILRDAPDVVSFPGGDPAVAAERLERLLFSRDSAASIARAAREWVVKRFATSDLRARALATYAEVFDAG